MKKVTKTITLLLVIMVPLFFLSGCMSDKKETSKNTKSKKIKIVTTTYPQYDWVKNILSKNAKNVEVVNLLNNGLDLHSYQPTPEDIVKISDADLFIYNGGESDTWVKGALKGAKNKNMVVINMMKSLEKNKALVEEKMAEGMQDSHNHNHNHNHDHKKDDAKKEHDEHKEHKHDEHKDKDKYANKHHQENHVEYDEHVWLSLKAAKKLVSDITEGITKIDPDNKTMYQKNAQNYKEQLSKLDSEYKEMISKAPHKTVIFADRFPFAYMTSDYHINYYAAFLGCSAETEASFETVSFLSKKIDELGIKDVLTIDGSNNKIAKTVIANTKNKNQKILRLNSMQSLTSKDRDEKNITYLKVMKDNLKILKKALYY